MARDNIIPLHRGVVEQPRDYAEPFRFAETDLRVRQIELQVSPGFTAHDAALLISGAYGACVFALVVAYCRGLVL